ncbi:Uma2 family endonuclease [Streptomyces sp. NPDC007100]|uniref:Uma2 family endonuclease n=1 Tax=Streptomyces sp. NPDC007100 TaxID=3155602 RepID=UPI0033CB1413
MTAVDDRLITDATEIFRRLEVPEGYKAELLRGNIVMMAGPDWVHNDIVESVLDQIPRKPWQRKQTQDVAFPRETSEPQPDLVVLPRDAFAGPGRLIPAEAVTFLLEVVSKSSVDHDYRIKRSVYAAGKVPAYLIVDPIAAECCLLTEPYGEGEDADYRIERISKFGEAVPLELLDVTLDTSEFPTLPGVRRYHRPR